MDEIVIGDKVYVSSKRAAKITGYAKDYVGQLCREGRVEARLVGRNWYVLESAVREHRFGKPEEKPSEAKETEVEQTDASSTATWKAPQYVPEAPAFVPNLTQKIEKPQESSPAVIDMQSAWREWFDAKRPLEALPDGAEDFRDEYLPMIVPENSVQAANEATKDDQYIVEESVEINRIEQPVSAASFGPESSVEIHKSYEIHKPQVVPERVAYLSAQRKQHPQEIRVPVQGNAYQRALLIMVAAVSLLIAVVGTGHADKLLTGTSLDYGAQREIVDFLGGKSVYKSSL